MPLLDHFRPPLFPKHKWESFLSNWATRVADEIAARLPSEFVVEEHVHAAPGVEVAIATYETARAAEPASLNGTDGGRAAVAVWAPPAPAHTIPALFPDAFEVRVFSTVGGMTLVAVVEFVSPGNKDRPEERRAFVAKCLGYLQQGVSLAMIDVVTTRRANLHNETMTALGASADARLSPDTHLYATAYRPVIRGEEAAIDVWKEPLSVGQSIPTMPLRLTGDLFIPVEFEAAYLEACRRRNIS
jgi:hypothetical protein